MLFPEVNHVLLRHLRAPKGAAPLKHCGFKLRGFVATRSPRPKRRGPVEALLLCCWLRPAVDLRAPKGAAPLKLGNV